MNEIEFFRRMKTCASTPAGAMDVRAGVWREVARIEATGCGPPFSLYRDCGAQAMLAAGLAIAAGAGLLAACYGSAVRDIDWISPYLGLFYNLGSLG